MTVHGQDYDAWFGPGLHNTAALSTLLAPYPTEEMYPWKAGVSVWIP